MSDWGYRPAKPVTDDTRKSTRRRIGFERGEPVIEIHDSISHEEAERHMEALKKQHEREGK